MAPSRERVVAVDAARTAGDVLRAGFHAAHRVAFKGQTINLVTEMDVRAEELIVGRLASAFPDDTILAEERGASAGRSGRRWIVDPLDGTTNYAHGLPLYSVSIALEVDRRIVLGVAYDPTADELYVAERGRGATVNDARSPSRQRRASTRVFCARAFRTTSARRPTRISRSTRRSRFARAACAGSGPPCSTWRGWPRVGSTASGSFVSARGTSRPPASSSRKPAGESRT